jgi:hypothetical protein
MYTINSDVKDIFLADQGNNRFLINFTPWSHSPNKAIT